MRVRVAVRKLSSGSYAALFPDFPRTSGFWVEKDTKIDRMTRRTWEHVPEVSKLKYQIITFDSDVVYDFEH